jgi:cell division septation protein DedD/nucleoid DNA-binding protein
MDKYLLLLLKEVNTIIIPDLGALTITNHSTGEIMFMPYLKYDDGKLATYISEKEGFELNDAKNLISKYVRDVQAVLDRGESYDMFQFGTFLKDKSGDVIFRNWDGSMPSEVKKDEVIVPVVEEKVEVIEVAEPEIKIEAEPIIEEVEVKEPEAVIVAETVVEQVEVTEELVEVTNEVLPTEIVQNNNNGSGYQNDIEGITINSSKDLEIQIGEKHVIAIRKVGPVEMLKDGILMENYADTLPKPEIVKPTPVVKEKRERPVVEPKVEIKEEKVIPEVSAPVQNEPVAPPKPKAELTPEELEAKRIKNAEREAERERRLSERMEKLAMKGMPEEAKEEEAPKAEAAKEKEDVKATVKEETKSTPKKEKEVKEPKRSFIVQKTANQKSSIVLAVSIIAVGILGGLGFILYNSGDISAPKLVEPKVLAENNKNIESTEADSAPEEESSSTVVVETSNTEEASVPAMEEETPAPVEEVKPVEKPKATPKPKPVPVVSAPVTSSSGGKYHIIGGSFSVEANAENFVNQMIAKGLDAKLLGRIDKMYVVSIGSYSSKGDAIAESKTIGVKGWIFKQK